MAINGRANKNLSVVLMAAVMFFSAAAVGCGGSGSAPETPPAAGPIGNPNGKPVDSATAGSVTGTVKLDGAPPPMKPITMSTVIYCEKQHATPPTTEDVVPGDNGTLQNVVVYLKGDFSQYSFPEPPTPPEMDQKGCMYVPHVVAVMAGAPLLFSSQDTTMHNIHPIPKVNREWNESQPRGGKPITETFTREEVAIPIKCNLHAWMRGYIAVIGNPYFQVTGQDGSFSLKNVPPGTYTLTAWQEVYGFSEQTITVGPNQTLTATITFHAPQKSSTELEHSSLEFRDRPDSANKPRARSSAG